MSELSVSVGGVRVLHSWIDIYGAVTARNCRFGGEGGGMTIVVNKQSFLCVKTSPTGPCQASGPEGPFAPPPRGPYPPDSTPFGGGSIRLYDNDMFSNCAYGSPARKSYGVAVIFEQIPAEFVLRDSQGLMEAPGDNPGSLFFVNPEIDLGQHGQVRSTVSARPS